MITPVALLILWVIGIHLVSVHAIGPAAMPAERPLPSISLPALPPDLQNFSRGADSSVARSNSSHLTLIIVIGVCVTTTALVLLLFLILLIRRQKKELEKPDAAGTGLPVWNKDLFPSPRNQLWKWRKGSSAMFKRYNYREIQKATDDFSTVIGKGGFGTVYKARFQDGLVAAVKRMNRISRQGEQEFCKEMEFLGRLHHRHLVTLKGFCVEKHERFLIYEYMENGSLKEHLHADSKMPLNWRTRLQIAVDVAIALEYLHCYCDPPLCHRDIKSSNILLDENFVAKVADFGLAHATPSSGSSPEQVSTDVRGTPGYMDPEYVVTQQLTEKSDIYSYGVLLLELITGRSAVQDTKNIVEWAQQFLTTESRIPQMIDPDCEDTYNAEELRSLAALAKMCTQKEGKVRPAIRQVLRFLHDRLEIETASVLQCTSMLVCDDKDGKASMPHLTMSDEVLSLSSTFSPITPISQCSKSFQIDTTPPISPL